jgi:hypothetical protein
MRERAAAGGRDDACVSEAQPDGPYWSGTGNDKPLSRLPPSTDPVFGPDGWGVPQWRTRVTAQDGRTADYGLRESNLDLRTFVWAGRVVKGRVAGRWGFSRPWKGTLTRGTELMQSCSCSRLGQACPAIAAVATAGPTATGSCIQLVELSDWGPVWGCQWRR